MGGPTAGAGGQALSRMARPGPPQRAQSDPLWDEIEGTFQDILGEYANMDLDMPIQPPDMSDPQDQMRYLKDLEALGMSSGPSASLMGRGGMDLKQALDMMKFQYKVQQDQTNMLMKLIPALEGNKELQAMFSAELLNKMMPGQFDVEPGGRFYGDPTVTMLTPETATEGMLYENIAAGAMPKALELAKAKDKKGMRDYFDQILEQLTKGGVNESVAIAIVNQLHAEAIGGAKAEEPVY